jgi:protein SCO1
VTRNALYALILAVLLPLVSYWIVKRSSKTAINIPPHYFGDTVLTSVVRGKNVNDTVWHKLPDFSLTNQLGQKVSWDDLKDEEGNGKIIVADFFFTRCPTICPRLTSNMKKLQQSITNSKRVGDKTPGFVHFLSFSIDPERDSVPQLKKWSDHFQINPRQWWLLTGDKKFIYDMVINDMKLGLVDGDGVDSNFIHTDRFVLIDPERQVRGYYHGLDTVDLKRLANDIVILSMEKRPGERSFFEGKLEIMAIAFFAAIIGAGALLLILQKKKNATTGLEKK